MTRPHRAIALLLVAPFLTFASALAPQHMHEAATGDEHNHVVAHSHFTPHQTVVHYGDDEEVEHDTERVLWLDSSILHERLYQTAGAPLIVAVHEQRRTEVGLSCGAGAQQKQTADPPLLHGPPQSPPSLRGPPSPRLSDPTGRYPFAQSIQ